MSSLDLKITERFLIPLGLVIKFTISMNPTGFEEQWTGHTYNSTK